MSLALRVEVLRESVEFSLSAQSAVAIPPSPLDDLGWITVMVGGYPTLREYDPGVDDDLDLDL